MRHRGPDDSFRTACGLTGAVRVTVTNRETPQTAVESVVLDCPAILIGRGGHCDISLQDPRVSYRHAYLQLLDDEMFCFDLSSRSGTFCRADRHRAGPLEPGEEIYIGPFSLRVTTDGADGANSAGDQSPAAGTAVEPEIVVPETVLNFLNGAPRPDPLALDRPVTLIGKSSRCRVKLADEGVSRVHCSVVRTRRGVWVVDLLGKGGTLVNGRAVERARLNAGDELAVGGFRMQVLAAATTRAMTRSRAAGLQRRAANAAGPPASSGGRPQAPLTLISREAAAPPAARSSDESTFTESFVMSLVGQFAAMQQQMFEQSQQTLTAMAEILRSRHQSEVDLAREELAHIRSLSVQLQELGRELSEQNRPAAAIAAPPADDVSADRAEQAVAGDPAPVAQDAAVEPAPVASADERPEVESSATAASAAAEQHATNAAASVDDAQPAPRPAESDPSDDRPPHEDPHDWLSQRIAAIEKERNSRWKKITRILTGTAADEYRP